MSRKSGVNPNETTRVSQGCVSLKYTQARRLHRTVGARNAQRASCGHKTETRSTYRLAPKWIDKLIPFRTYYEQNTKEDGSDVASLDHEDLQQQAQIEEDLFGPIDEGLSAYASATHRIDEVSFRLAQQQYDRAKSDRERQDAMNKKLDVIGRVLFRFSA